MTDKKEIIVHGVDVSECEKLAPYNGYDEETKCNPSCCQNSPNCKFKQLKRAERKIKELSKVSVGFADKCRKMGLDIFHLKDKNNKLTRELQAKERELEPFKDDYFTNLDIKNIVELAKKSIRLTTESRKLKDVLKKVNDICANCGNKNTRWCNNDCGIFSILNIINKKGSGENGDT